MSYLIIGASSGLGRDLSYSFAEKKNDLILVARDKKDLEAIKSDIEIKHNVSVIIITADLSSLDNIDLQLFSDEEIYKNLKGVLFPIGHMFENDNVNLNIKNIQAIICSNYLSITYIVSKLTKYFSSSSNFSIVGFGSVSGIIGRKVNSNYAASKRALESYFESLGFENIGNNINIQFYILGYLNTNLSFGQNLNLPKGSTKKLSLIVLKNINKKFKKKYYPFFWLIIVFLLKVTPFSFIIKLNKFFK